MDSTEYQNRPQGGHYFDTQDCNDTRLLNLEDIAPYIAQAGFYEEANVLGNLNLFLRNDERVWRSICKARYMKRFSRGLFKRTHLAFYAKEGDIERVKFLLDHGAIRYINWKDSFGRTPLSEALESNHKDVIEELIKRGGIANRPVEGIVSDKIGSDAIDDEIWSLTVIFDKYLVVGTMLGHILIRSLDTLLVIARLEGHVDEVKALISLSDTSFVSAGRDHTVRIWSMEKNVWKCDRVLVSHTGCVWSLALLKNGSIASGGSDSTVSIWDPITGIEIAVLRHPSSVLALTATPDGLAVGCGDGSIHLWNLQYRGVAQFGNIQFGSVCCMAMIPDGRCVAGYSDSNILRIINIKTLTVDLELIGHTDAVYVVGVLSDGRIVSGSRDRTVRIWDVKKNTSLELQEHTSVILSLSVGSNDTIVSGDAHGTLILWN